MTIVTAARVRCLTSGVVRGKRAQSGPRRYLPGGWAKDTLPVNFFLIEHESGLCLFDAGQSARAARPGYISRWHPYLRLARFELTADDEPAAQLRALGHDPADVRWVVLSHLHTDHVGGLEPFAGAEILVARSEWERFRGLKGRLRGYLPQHWPADAEPRLVEGTLDLTEGGSLSIVPLPGHTRGHMGLVVRAEGGGWLLAGDAAHTPAELEATIVGFCRREGLVPLLTHDPLAGTGQDSTRSTSSVVSSPGTPSRRARTNGALSRTP